MYFEGQGVSKDFAQAMQWFRKSADQGNPGAQADLGDMYFNGQGEPQDFVQAVQWYRKAADQGYAMAQSNLGDMYCNGHGVHQDLVIAYALYSLAISKGQSGSGLIVPLRDVLTTRMSAAQAIAGQALKQQMEAMGVSNALDAYLKPGTKRDF